MFTCGFENLGLSVQLSTQLSIVISYWVSMVLRHFMKIMRAMIIFCAYSSSASDWFIFAHAICIWNTSMPCQWCGLWLCSCAHCISSMIWSQNCVVCACMFCCRWRQGIRDIQTHRRYLLDSIPGSSCEVGSHRRTLTRISINIIQKLLTIYQSRDIL